VLRTLLNQPPGDRQAESAEPTRDEDQLRRFRRQP
jgi:hypothetical protein